MLVMFMLGIMIGLGIGGIVGFVNGYDKGVWHERRMKKR